ncbi:MAG: fibronectin type III domain-containing protein [Acidobacteriota bacterium]
MCSEPTASVRPPGRALCLLLVLAAAFALSACGKKGPPLPPLRNVPLTTDDLEVRQEGRLVLIDLTYPTTTISGLPLDGIDGIELWSYTRPMPSLDDPLPQLDRREFEAAAEELLVLRGSELESSIVGNKVQLRIPVEELTDDDPSATILAVRTVKGVELSDFSNLRAVIAREPPEPPTGLTVEAKPPGVLLTWEAAEDPARFDIFRRRSSERGYGAAIRRLNGAERRLLDRSASFGERYIYTVRAVAGTEEATVSSDPAGEVEIEYRDLFAPPLPRNFVALPERGQVRLRWDPSAAPDVLGYILLRRDPGRTDFAAIVDAPIEAEEYLDRGLGSGLTFAYRIQAVDTNGNTSGESRPIEATVR